jgi:hypothetical protein
MTRQHCHQHDSTSTSRCGQVTPIAPSPAWLSRDIMQLLDHQQYMTSAASRHAASSYRYYSPLCLVLGPMQALWCTAWHLCEAYIFQRLMFEDFKLWTPKLNFLKDLIWESGLHLIGAPIRCPYSINLVKKHLTTSCQSIQSLKLSRQIHHWQERSRSPSIYSLANHSEAADED